MTMPGRLGAYVNAGYSGDGVKCDESSMSAADVSLNNCSENASCTDDDGSFSCVCAMLATMVMVSSVPISMSVPTLLNNCSDNAPVPKMVLRLCATLATMVMGRVYQYRRMRMLR